MEVKTVSQLKDVRQHRRSIDPRLDLGDAGFGVFDREAKLALLIFVGRAERRFVGFVESIEPQLYRYPAINPRAFRASVQAFISTIT